MSDDEPRTMTGAEMAARLVVGGTEDDLDAVIEAHDARSKRETVVHLDDPVHDTWLVECGGCGDTVLAGTTRQGALAAADRHNDEVHHGSFRVADYIGSMTSE